MMRVGLLALALMLLSSTSWAAEWHIKPFLGVTFGGDTTFLLDLDQVAGSHKFGYGVSGALFWDLFGVEADYGRTPGFFTGTGGRGLVVTSSVSTLTGNFVVALPRRFTPYGLRPYFVGGAGVMRIRATDLVLALPLDRKLATLDFGGGATAFFNERIGISWDVRYFRSVGGKDEQIGISLGPEQLSFWRAAMALTIRH